MELQPLGCFSGRRRRRRRKELGLLLLPPPLLCISPHPHPRAPRSRIASFLREENLLLALAFSDTAPEATPGGVCGEHQPFPEAATGSVGSPPALGKEASSHSQNGKSSSPAFGCGGGDRNLGDQDPVRRPPPPLMHSFPGALPRRPRSHCSPFSPFSGDRRSGMRV